MTIVKDGKNIISKRKYVKELKYKVDVAARTKSKVHLQFELPTTEDPAILNEALTIDPTIWHQVHIAALQQLSSTHCDETFRIEYRLDVFVKHQSKTEFGMGNFVSFPIRIASS